MIRHLTAGLCALAALSFAAAASAQDDPMKHIINNPNPASLIVYGTAPHKIIKDASVQSGQAVEVKASGVGNPYDVGAQTSLDKPIKAGDEIECDIFLKATRDDGQAPSLHALLQINQAPYTAVGQTDFNVTNQWQLYTLKVTADKDYDKGQLVFAVQLNGAKQSVDIGPAFVFDNSRTF